MKTWLKAFPAWLRLLQPRVLRGNLMVVERNGGLGDILCLFPALEILRRRHPEACLVVLTSRVFVDFVRRTCVADVVLASDTRGIAWLRRRMRPLLDCHALLPDEQTPPQPRARIHLMEEFARLLGCDGRPLACPKISAAPWAHARVSALLRQEGLDARPLVVVHSGPTWPVKQWPLSHWQELTVRLQNECGATVVQAGLDGQPGDPAAHTPRIPEAHDWVNRLTLEETVALLAQARLFIGVDSGLLHLANALGVPALGLFGPTDPSCFMPPDHPDRGLSVRLPCSGCHHHADGPLHWRTGCPHQVQCMSGLGTDLVLERCRAFFS